MSTELKRLGIVLIIVSFLFGCFPLFRVEVNAESKKTIKFSADMGADSNGKYNGKVSVKFNGDIFKKMNVDNKDLALLAASMSAASCKQGGKPKHSGAYFLGNAYKTLGFKKNNVYIFNYKKNKDEEVFGQEKVAKDKNGNSLKNEHCFGIGVKEMNIGGTETCVMIISLRGTEEILIEGPRDMNKEYTRDYRDKVIAGIKQYINDHSELNNKPIKILVTGHSLGGGAANLVGAMKMKTWNSMGWNSEIEKKDIVTFTFGAINVFDEKEDSSVHDEKYDNILNYFNYWDTFGPNGDGFNGIKPMGGEISCTRKYGKMKVFVNDFRNDFKSAGSTYANHNMAGYVKAAAGSVTFITHDNNTHKKYRIARIKPATLEENGRVTSVCGICGEGHKYEVIFMPKTIKVKKSLVAYNGKAQKPGVIVKTAKGKNIPNNYYSVSYKNNRIIGTATATIRFKGLYSGSVKKTFKIGPKGSELVKCNGGKNKITVRWKKTTNVSGYQIQYSTGKNFKAKSTKTITVKGNKKVTYVIDKLKNGKKYYARVRTYKAILLKNHYSPWSKVKSVKTKSVSGKEKAISAYRKFLEKENHQSDGFGTYTVEDFAIKDLNGDKIPELLIHGGGRMDYSKIYTYSGGSVKFVHQGTSLNVYSNGIIKIQFLSGSGYWLYSYYRMKGDKTKYEYRYAEWYNDILETGEYTYSEGEKSGNDDSTKVPYANIKKNLSKILDGAKDVTPKYHPNTQDNRKKYLK